MTVRTLYKYELHKMLLSFRGIWFIGALIILKIGVLYMLPELKDSRILFSQKQYDAVLETIAGETTIEKEQYIKETYQGYKDVLEQFSENQKSYMSGEMEEKAWQEYIKEYEIARLYSNAFSILNEKAEQFLLQRPWGNLSTPAYLYEFGWNSIFTYLSYPDPLSLLLVFVLGIQFICPEIGSGSMKVIRATRNGQRPLFLSKLYALLTLLLTIAAINTVTELGVFSLRFSLEGGNWPIYSITPFAKEVIDFTLREGLLALVLIRGIGLILTGLLIWAVACLTGKVAYACFCVITMVLLPWLLLPNMVYWISTWITGTPVIKTKHRFIPLLILSVVIGLLLWMAYYVAFKGIRRTRKITSMGG